MRRWNLTQSTLLSLTLAADVRCGGTDYSNDHIWELSLGQGEPPAVALSTTFGLRARALRLFPRFALGDQEACDPEGFARRPVIRNFYTNFARLDFSPFADIDVSAEFWVPQSHAILGRFWVRNLSDKPKTLQLEWAAVLSPVEGQRMAASEISGTTVLSGQTGNLSPLVFMTGGARPGKSPYPSLVRELEIPAGGELCTAWSQTASSSPEASLDLARELNALSWETHSAAIELLNAGQVEIYTGNPDWDLAFYLSQCVSQSLFVGPTDKLPKPSYVSTRRPDQGYSLRGDGSDYNHLWSGQTPLDGYLLSKLLLPGSPEQLKGILLNFFSSQKEDGFIDLKPGLGGLQSRALSTPLLATLTWRCYKSLLDQGQEAEEFLSQAYPVLIRYFDAWFSPERDSDQDGLPEWTHLMQTGLEEHPLFSVWQPWSQGTDIRTAESPALAALLYRECRTLQQMAKLLKARKDQNRLKNIAARLKSSLDAMWHESEARYLYRDRESHLTSQGELIAEQTGPGTLQIHRRFETPVRLILKISANGETRPQPRIFIHGENASGQHRIEHIEAEQIRWSMERGMLSGERIYTSVEKIELQGLLPQDTFTLSTAGFECQDITLLLPLWAGIPDSEQAEKLIEGSILNEDLFWRPYGIPACVQAAGGEQNICESVQISLNSLVCEGLLAYGRRSEAAELVTRLMAGVTQNLNREGVLSRSFTASTGEGIGEKNALGGLAPVGLFLDVLGVQPKSHAAVAITGFNPFPWPVTVKYRGTTILRQKDKTIVIFPDGQTVETAEESPHLIRLQDG